MNQIQNQNENQQDSWVLLKKFFQQKVVQMGILLSFVAILFLFVITVFVSKVFTAGEVADLWLDPASSSVTAGQNFNIDINLDTKSYDVVVVKAVVDYDPTDFELVSWNTDNTVFAPGNTCVYNSKPCEIITEDPVNGEIIVTVSKPSPGVNTSNGLVGTLTFKALHSIQPVMDNLTLHYIAFENYDDSDVILEGDEGRDILTNVFHSTITAILPVPTNLNVIAFSATQINLSWTAPSDAGITGYKIYRSLDGVSFSELTTTSNLNYSDTGLTPLTTYYYKVSSIDASSESAQSSPSSSTTLADTTAPSVPSNLSAQGVSMYDVNLSWTASADNVAVTGYRIYREGSPIDTTTNTTYQDSGLIPGTEYSYTVLAYDEAGNESNQSNSANGTTLPDTEAPTIPTSLSATAVSLFQIDLDWDASTDNVGVVGYKIYRSLDGSSFTEFTTTTNTSYSNTGLTPSTEYFYQISAYDAEDNESGKTATVSATTNGDTTAPSVPANLTVTPTSMTQLDLSWSASTDDVGVDGYKLYRSPDGIIFTEIATPVVTSYSDIGLTLDTTYYYQVSAYDAAGNESNQSPVVSGKTLADTVVPTTPVGLSGSVISQTQINLSWNASSDNIGVAGYKVYRNGAEVANITEVTYEDTGLAPGTLYTYRVSAYDAAGNESPQSNPISRTTSTQTYGLSDFINVALDWLENDPTSPGDINGDGEVDSRDMGVIMSNWE